MSSAEHAFDEFHDDVPYWSAFAGQMLLDEIEIKRNMKVVDLGCGSGFPSIQIAQFLGGDSEVVGIDHNEALLKKMKQKCVSYGLSDKLCKQFLGKFEEFPFESYFDLCVSVNGLNCVDSVESSVEKCWKVLKDGGKFVFVYNSNKTFFEFYCLLEEVMKEAFLDGKIVESDHFLFTNRLRTHIDKKRYSLEKMKSVLENTGFKVEKVVERTFSMRFVDFDAFIGMQFIKVFFFSSWKKLLEGYIISDEIFKEVGKRFNKSSPRKVTVPYILISCEKPNYT